MSGQRWDAMSVTEYQQQGQAKSKWTKIGAAFTNQDGSIGVQLDCLPLDGRIVLQIPLTYEQKQARYAQRNQQGGGQQGYQQQPQQQGRGGGGFGGRGGGGGRGGYGGGGGQQQSFQQPNQPAPYQPEPSDGTDFDYGHNEGGGGDDVPFR
jgi:hypothetical protein